MKRFDIKVLPILAAAALTLLQGCELEKKLLTVKQIGKATIEGFFSELDGLVSAGEGMHREMKTFIDREYLRYGDIRGDLLNATIDANEGDLLAFNYELTAEHVATYPRSLWAAGWSIVTEANNIIYYGEKMRERGEYPLPTQDAVIDRVIAQAYFGRAFAHFCLCNCYAWPYNYTADHSHIGIPVMDHVPGFNDKVDRKSVKVVYDQIFSDIAHARKLFRSSAEKSPGAAASTCQIEAIEDCYHVSDIACEALLARIYLYIEDWDNAEKCAKNVMDKVKLTSRDKYVQMFRSSQENPGEEAILRMNSFGSTTSMASFYDPSKTNDFVPEPSVYSLFEDDDIRKSLLTYVPLPSEEIYKPGLVLNGVCKYSYDRTITDPDKQCSDCFVFRASEMYLIHGEACVMGRGDTASAEADLKALIGRARGIPATSVSLTYSGKDGMLSLIELERKRELCYEGHRFFDLIRRRENITRPATSNSKLKNLPYPDYRYLLPIDRMECQYNEYIQQNEGYDDYKTN